MRYFIKNFTAVFFTLFFCLQNAKAQVVDYSKFIKLEGLSQGMVLDIMQDNQGFMWFGTKDGLNRYDGHNFKVYTHDGYNKNSICGNHCTSLLQDSKGRIWIATESDGINLLNPKTQKFYHAQIIDKNLKGQGYSLIRKLVEDKQGNIWIFTLSQIYKINNFENYPANQDFSERIEIVADRKNFPLIDRNNTQTLFDNFPLCVAYNESKPFVNINNTLRQVFLNQKNAEQSICFNTGEFLEVINKDFSKKISLIVNGGYVTFNVLRSGKIAYFNQRYIWVFTPEQFREIDSLTPQNATVILEKESRSVSQIFEDYNGYFWIATLGYGVYKFNPKLTKFHSYLNSNSIGNIFQSANKTVFVQSLYPKFDIYKLNKVQNTMELIKSSLNNRNLIIMDMIQDVKKNYWFTCKSNADSLQVMQYSETLQLQKTINLSNTFQFEFQKPQSQIVGDTIFWLGLPDGLLCKINMRTGKQTTYNYKKLLLQKAGGFASNFLYLVNETLWICTQKGLVKVTQINTNPVFEIFSNSVLSKTSLSNDVTTGCILDPYDSNLLWVSTKGGGLEQLNLTTKKFRHFKQEQGLPNNVVYKLLLGTDKNLWMSTNKGIAMLNSKTLNFTTYNQTDGLQDDEFNSYSGCNGTDGNLYFGGINGLTYFNPIEVNASVKKPVVQIINLKINNLAVLPTDSIKIISIAIEYLKELNLAYNQNQLSFELGILDFANPQKHQFKYMLEGIDNDWILAANNRFANYAQLPSGNYIFKMQGSVSGDVWSDIAELKVIIKPPFYRTWWAYLLYLIGFLFLVYSWYKNLTRRIRLSAQLIYKEREAKQLEQLDELKTNFFANISHEIRTPLTLILAPSDELLKKNPNEKMYELINRNAKRMLTLINQILDISKLEAGQMKLNFKEVDVAQFLQNNLEDFNSMAEQKKIAYTIHQNKQSVIGNIDEDKFEKIIFNLLSNAFKFTNAGQSVAATINYNTALTEVTIKVQDTGIGIPADKLDSVFLRFYQNNSNTKRKHEGTGIGLALVKELVELMKGTISVKSSVQEGTCFEVCLPIVNK